MDDNEARERVGRVEALLEEVEALPDPAARDTATEVVQALLDLYGEGLARMVGHIAERDDGALADALASDEVVSHLLLLHGLHPVPLEQRVRGALDEVRPYLESHGGGVELLSVSDGVARLALQGSCNGCPSSAVTLKLAIEDAIHKAAPDLDEIEAQEADQPAPAPAPGLIQLEVSDALRGAPRPPQVNGSWVMAGGMRDLAAGAPLLKQVAGEPVLFVRLGERTLAYRPSCPGCGQSLDHGTLEGRELACAGCGHRYDVQRAGRCLDSSDLHLQPVPLLVDGDGLVRIALRAAA